MSETLQRELGPNPPAPPSGRVEDCSAAILAAAEVVLARFGLERLSLYEVAKVSLIPVARIHQFFSDRNALLGALSTRYLQGLSFAVEWRDPVEGEGRWPRQVHRLIARLATVAENPAVAYLVLCGPFDEASSEPRLEATHKLSVALQREFEQDESLGGGRRSNEAFDYAAEMVFACLRRGHMVERRISETAIDMAEHAVLSFLSASSPTVTPLQN